MFEVVVGAVLTQNAAWSNVEKAIDRLRVAGLLSLQALLDTDHPFLMEGFGKGLIFLILFGAMAFNGCRSFSRIEVLQAPTSLVFPVG